jgi:hypothetical protein
MGIKPFLIPLLCTGYIDRTGIGIIGFWEDTASGVKTL